MSSRGVSRRQFLGGLGAAALLGWSGPKAYGSDGRPVLEAGQGMADATPPLGIEMGGFRRPPGQERRITGIRQRTAVRALALRCRDQQAAIVSLDLLAVSRDFTRRVQQAVSRKTGIPASNIRLCATHSHSTPTFLSLRQWGAVSPEYMNTVEQRVIEAVQQARQDLAPAELFAGSERAVGGNFNRTAKTWKTDRDFNDKATDGERWLDTLVHVLRFERGQERPALVWYHFSAHTVCYTDDHAGPDWPGLVSEQLNKEDRLVPSFLQGHCGDVNPGDGKPWIGDPNTTSRAVFQALRQALNNARRVKVESLRGDNTEFNVPFDLDLFNDQMARYQREPARATSGEWVDASFSQEWAVWAADWDFRLRGYPAPLSALRLGEVGLLFHPAELYSFYGLDLRHGSPFDKTIVVGYADDLVGYLTDPAAYKAGEYAAVVVPKILSLPPFTQNAARLMTDAGKQLLRKVAG